ncbi:unnamed protein product [Leptidea sinapis]|uniref:Uncharacterized protein n=1 Tax=Leptidea sinapis TaxID=189913 RepID=A0A5E4Q4S0_9NEOP|nr:unnamed protein product [Leptidea sinapis]
MINTMKTYIVMLLVVHTVSSLHLEKVAETVQNGIKNFKHHLKEKAASLQKLTEEFDLHKPHKPLYPYAKHVVQEEHYSKKTPLVIDPYQIERLKHYFEPHHKPLTYIPHYAP